MSNVTAAHQTGRLAFTGCRDTRSYVCVLAGSLNLGRNDIFVNVLRRIARRNTDTFRQHATVKIKA